MAEPIIRLAARVADLSRRRCRRACVARCQPYHQCRRICRHRRLLGIGQVDADGGARLPRPAERRQLFLRGCRRRATRRTRPRAAAQRAARLRVPEFQFAGAHQRGGKRRVALVLRRLRAGWDRLARGTGSRGAQTAGSRRSREQHAGSALGRSAAARGDRTRVDQRSEPAARRRADRQPRYPHVARHHADADTAQPRARRYRRGCHARGGYCRLCRPHANHARRRDRLRRQQADSRKRGARARDRRRRRCRRARGVSRWP